PEGARHRRADRLRVFGRHGDEIEVHDHGHLAAAGHHERRGPEVGFDAVRVEMRLRSPAGVRDGERRSDGGPSDAGAKPRVAHGGAQAPARNSACWATAMLSPRIPHISSMSGAVTTSGGASAANSLPQRRIRPRSRAARSTTLPERSVSVNCSPYRPFLTY